MRFVTQHTRLRLAVLALTLSSLLPGCAGPNKGVRISQPPKPPTFEYRVQSGDTLYSIAWRHEMNYVELARMNNIAHPYTIYPNQVLEVTRALVSAHTETAPETAPEPETAQQPIPEVQKPVMEPAPVPTSPTPVPVTPPVAPQPAPRMAASGWSWPTSGEMSKTFGPDNKGINFKLGRGSEIHAAGNGRVVYASTGIGGYRSLVIIRHSERYLSAYSLDQGMLVEENQLVRSGEVIARVADDSGKDLHFEVRDRGQPIDPLKVLDAE